MPPGPLSIVEQAPSHDGAPTYAAYARRWPGKPRPLYAVRIYDTTPGAAAPNRTSEVAKVIQEKTEGYRGTADAHDRVEVVAIPMTLDATDQQRADRCREHQLAEVRSRGGSGKEDWGEWALPKLACDDAVYRQAIIIIDQLDNGWEGAFDRPKVPVGRGFDIPGKWEWEGTALDSRSNPPNWQENPFGTCLYVKWDLQLSAKEQARIQEEGDVPLPEVLIQGFALVVLDNLLQRITDGLSTSWYTINAPKWYLELEKAA